MSEKRGRLFFVRHGQADWPNWDRPDDERPLTNAGRDEMERVAQLLVRLKVAPDIILASPLPRARQTAEIVAHALQMEVRVEEILAPGFSATKLHQLQEKHQRGDLMLVGHEDDFSLAIRSLTNGRIKLAKAGVALVELSAPDHGRLLWLLPPVIATASLA